MHCETLHGANEITFLIIYCTPMYMALEWRVILVEHCVILVLLLIMHLLDLYLCRTTINVIAVTCFLCVQVNSQNKEPNTEVTEQEEMLHVFIYKLTTCTAFSLCQVYAQQ